MAVDRPDVEPGAEEPIARHDPAGVVAAWTIEDLSQEEFDKLASQLRARDLADMLPDDVPGIGSRRKL